MAKLGIAQTTKFSIGTAEVRIGPLSSANKLTQSHSIGLLDDVTLEVSQENIDLQGGFPRTIVDTAIVSQDATVNATLREYSRRNIRVMLGEGVESVAATDASTTLSANAASGATALTLTAALTGASDGDLVVVYPVGSPSDVSVCEIASGSGGTSLTLNTDTPTLFAYTSGAVVYLAHHVPLGNVQQTNYFAVQFLQQERSTGRPIGFNFWKASISSGMSLSSNAEDFASTEMQIKIVEPGFQEYDSGGTGDLKHLSTIIPSNPTGLMFGGGD